MSCVLHSCFAPKWLSLSVVVVGDFVVVVVVSIVANYSLLIFSLSLGPTRMNKAPISLPWRASMFEQPRSTTTAPTATTITSDALAGTGTARIHFYADDEDNNNSKSLQSSENPHNANNYPSK